MPSFTLRLKDVDRITKGHWGLDTYPLETLHGKPTGLAPELREGLNGKILDHFYNQEIGQETIEMFTLAMRRKMNEIMPLYIQVYKSELLEIDPLSTMLIRNTSTDQRTEATQAADNSSSSGNNSGTQTGKNFEMPQTQLDLDDESYGTSATEGTSVAESTVNGTSNSTGNTTANGQGNSETSGYTGPASELLQRFRATFLNVDMLIIDDLEKAGLFSLLWDTGDSYTLDRGPFNPYGYGY